MTTACCACFRRRNIKYKRDDVDVVDDSDDDDVCSRNLRVEDVPRSKPTSIIERVEKARNVQCLIRAVNEAAMRVNPSNPDAFLSLLSSTRVGRAEQLDDDDDVSDQAVQTDQPLRLRVDNGSSARLKQLQREMADLKSQQHITEIVSFVTLPIAVILMLLFADKLWVAM